VEFFISHIFAKHSILSYIISNKRSEFISRFFKSLVLALDIRLYYISGYYLVSQMVTYLFVIGALES